MSSLLVSDILPSQRPCVLNHQSCSFLLTKSVQYQYNMAAFVCIECALYQYQYQCMIHAVYKGHPILGLIPYAAIEDPGQLHTGYAVEQLPCTKCSPTSSFSISMECCFLLECSPSEYYKALCLLLYNATFVLIFRSNCTMIV